jgi:inosose dehydratase
MFAENTIKLGIAPINWTNDDLPELGGHIPFDQCIAEMAQAGFGGTEVGNKYPKDPAVLKPALDQHGLQVASAWFSTFFSESGLTRETVEGFIAHMNFLKACGADRVNVCECGSCVQGGPKHVFDRPAYSDAQWSRVAEGLNVLGRIARENGMFMAYHYHMGTMVQTAAETDRLMAMTDPEAVFLLMDSGHAYYAGDDPVALTKKYAPRIKHVHLKDIRQDVLDRVHAEKMNFLDSVKAGAFTVPGDGCIDFDPIFAELARSGYAGWMVVEAEQDPDRANPLEYAQIARKYIREHAGV